MNYLSLKKLAVFLVLVTVCLNINAQTDDNLPKVVPAIDAEIHQKIVEQLFTLDALDAPENEFTLILRYSPTFESTRQIVFAARDEKIFVTEYVSNGDIEAKANEYLLRYGMEDPAILAQNIGVTKREFNIPAKLEQSWRANLLESVGKALKSQKPTIKPKDGKPLTATVLLHGTTYQIWYASGGARMYFWEYGAKLNAPNDPEDSPFIRQMKLIYREISKQK